MSNREDRDQRFALLELDDEPSPKAGDPPGAPAAPTQKVIAYHLDECDPQPTSGQAASAVNHVRQYQLVEGEWFEGPRLCTGGPPLLVCNIRHWSDPSGTDVFVCVRCLRVLLLQDDDLRGPPDGRFSWGGVLPR